METINVCVKSKERYAWFDDTGRIPPCGYFDKGYCDGRFGGFCKDHVKRYHVFSTDAVSDELLTEFVAFIERATEAARKGAVKK